jgi:hypothetical protein
MSEHSGAGDEQSLRMLATAYALAADQGDGAMYADVFAPGGRMRVLRRSAPDVVVTEVTGRDELALVPGMLSKAYDRTFHFVGQSSYVIDQDVATGTVYCQAHHLSTSGRAGTSYVMHIRYEDEYGRSEASGWKITSRSAWIEWTETRVASP